MYWKMLVIGIMAVSFVYMINAIDVETNIEFYPSKGSILYITNKTTYEWTEIEVNETCVIFNSTLSYCSSTTGVDWLRTIDFTPTFYIRSCSNLTVQYTNPFLPKIFPKRCA